MSKMDELCIQFKKSRLETYELFKNIIKFGQSLLYGVDSINNPILSLIQKNEYEIKKRGDLEGNINYKHLISYFIVYDPFNKKILSYQRTSHSGEQRLVGNKSIGWGGHIGFNDFRSHFDYVTEDNKIESISNNGQRTFFFKKELYEELTGFLNNKIKIIPNSFGKPLDIELKGEDFLIDIPQKIIDLFKIKKLHKTDLNNKEQKENLNILYGNSNDLFLLCDDYFMLNDNSNDVSKDHLGVVHILPYFNKRNCNGNNIKSNEKNNTNLEWKTIDELNDQTTLEEYESWSKILIEYLYDYLK